MIAAARLIVGAVLAGAAGAAVGALAATTWPRTLVALVVAVFVAGAALGCGRSDP